MEIFTLLILFIGGIIAGLYGSCVGSGALVTFPLLILSGLPIHTAIGTNRLGAVFLELSSAIKFFLQHQLNLKLGILLGIVAAIGALLGTKIVISINERSLNLIIAIVFLIIFIVLMFKDKIGIKQKKIMKKNIFVISLFTFLLGIYGGFFGGGFGTFIMILLVLFGFTFIKGAALGRVIGTIMSIVSFIIFAINDLVVYSYGISLAIGSFIGGWIGAGIAVKKGDPYIKVILSIVIIITIIKLFLDYLGIIL
ncbi:sulfite exporter TauE/SafE family protein [Nanoarchaeota archaeon]